LGRGDALRGLLAHKRFALQRSDRLQKALAMAEGNAQPLKVGFRQLGENLGVDVMFTERCLILSQTEVP
jgi:hypothetical protein